MKIAIWNIGHFSGGNAENSTVKEEELALMTEKYRAYVYDEVGADVIGLCENSPMFCNAQKGPVFAKTAIFDKYPIRYEEIQLNYSANALYAKTGVAAARRHRFIANDTQTITHTKLIKASDYYYIKGELLLDGVPVTLIVCHLAFDCNKNPDTVNINQLKELVRVTKDDPRVIIAGDFNCRDFATMRIFEDAGYTLLNDGSFLSFPTGMDNCALDNIVIKGVRGENVRLHPTELSDHYALSADIFAE